MKKSIWEKLITILFLCLLQSFVGEIKAEENICKYSNEKEYKSCKKGDFEQILPSYPFYLKGGGESRRYIIYRFYEDYNFCTDIVKKGAQGYGNKRLNISSENGKEIKISKGTFKNFSADINISEEETIPSENFMNWSARDFPCWELNFIKYKLTYLDKNLLEKDLFFAINTGFKKTNDTLIKSFLKDITKLENNSFRSRDEIIRLISLKINKQERDINILNNVLKINNDICLDAQSSKFPDLVEKYRRLSKSIHASRNILNMPPSKNIKSICN